MLQFAPVRSRLEPDRSQTRRRAQDHRGPAGLSPPPRCSRNQSSSSRESTAASAFPILAPSKAGPCGSGSETVTIPGMPGLQVGDGEAMRHLALCGCRVARLTAFTVKADIDAGRLVPFSKSSTQAISRSFMLSTSARADRCRRASALFLSSYATMSDCDQMGRALASPHCTDT